MDRLFPCLEVLHKHPQPCTHSHGYRWRRLVVVASPCAAVAHGSGWPVAGMEQLWALTGQISARQGPSWCPSACGVGWRQKAPGQPLSPAAMGTNLPLTPADSAQADQDPRPSPSPAHNPSSFCSPVLSLNLGPAGLLTEHSLWPSTWALASASGLLHSLSLAWAQGSWRAGKARRPKPSVGACAQAEHGGCGPWASRAVGFKCQGSAVEQSRQGSPLAEAARCWAERDE